MVAAADLTFVLDENLGGAIPQVLQLARFPPVGRITTLHELGFPRGLGVLDPEWLSKLGQDDHYVGVTRDGRILSTAVQAGAWSGSGLRLFLLAKAWGQLPRPELVRAMTYWWPSIVAYAEAGAPGTAWTVPPQVPPPGTKGIKLVTGWALPTGD